MARNVTDKTQYRFADLVDLSAFASMLESFAKATGISNGLVDVNGELLSQAGWENACTRYHRAHPETAQRCRESNLAIMHDLRDGHVANSLCHNGLMDYATPVVVEGQQLATLFLGQVLHTAPDLEFFRNQAEKFGFDEIEYMKSIESVPIIDKSHAEALMTVMVGMAQTLAASGLARLRQATLEHEISVNTEKRIQLEDILNFSPIAIGWSDDDGRIEYINLQFTQLFGYELSDLPNLETWYRLAYPDENYRESVIRPWLRDVARSHQSGLEADIVCKDGSVRRVIIRASRVAQRRLVNFTDITEHWKSEQREQAHDAMLGMVARGAKLNDILIAIVQEIEREDKTALCSIMLLDFEGKCLHTGAAPSLPESYNNALEGVEIGPNVGCCGTAAYLGQRVIAEDIQTNELWKPYAHLAQKAGLRACWSEPIISSRDKVLGTFAIYHTEPKIPKPWDIERIGYAANLSAIAIENRYALEELERRAYTDYLTGLANRRYFFEKAENELARALRYSKKLSILMLDIDHFKQVNDNYGHEAGDVVLKKLAEICLASLRAIDIIGRIGGEEFAILLPETSIETAMETAERLRIALSSTAVQLDNGLSLHFTASFGVVTLEEKNDTVDMLLNRADQALYKAKGDGRNRVCKYQQ
ncbi:MAG: diguanylate cyclase [Methylotenera sp.]|uniref:diguanylate cyclase n=1 Tax=Methylotenera sp. TaxID=2051956 RepID=UPI002487EBE2|nr:diguanylate cyclase [Methylotenera sp.]MDI1308530.1 diguanylate cyclase [Methylotenera sp.]